MNETEILSELKHFVILKRWAGSIPRIRKVMAEIIKILETRAVRNSMLIVIEKGKTGLWYGTIDPPLGPYKGPLIAESSIDGVLDQISPTIRSMREAATEKNFGDGQD